MDRSDWLGLLKQTAMGVASELAHNAHNDRLMGWIKKRGLNAYWRDGILHAEICGKSGTLHTVFISTYKDEAVTSFGCVSDIVLTPDKAVIAFHCLCSPTTYSHWKMNKSSRWLMLRYVVPTAALFEEYFLNIINEMAVECDNMETLFNSGTLDEVPYGQ